MLAYYWLSIHSDTVCNKDNFYILQKELDRLVWRLKAYKAIGKILLKEILPEILEGLSAMLIL